MVFTVVQITDAEKAVQSETFDPVSKDVPIETLPHPEFTPFANVILLAGAWGFTL